MSSLKIILGMAALAAAVLVMGIVFRMLEGRAKNFLLKLFGTVPTEKLPYLRRSFLLSKAELAFYHSLISAVAGKYSIACKVRIADVLMVSSGANNRMRHFNRIAAKHVDFLLLTIDTMKPQLAIELDDRSHDAEDRQDRDDFVNAAFTAAGLPLLRVRAAASYAPSELARQISAALGSHP